MHEHSNDCPTFHADRLGAEVLAHKTSAERKAAGLYFTPVEDHHARGAGAQLQQRFNFPVVDLANLRVVIEVRDRAAMGHQREAPDIEREVFGKWTRIADEDTLR